MGNKSQREIEENQLIQFNAEKYIQIGLTKNDISELLAAFESFEPKNGCINVTKIKDLYKDSAEKEKIDFQLQNYTSLNRDDFLTIMGQDIIEKKLKYKNIEFDYGDKQVTCYFCPYTSNKSR